MQGGIMRRSSPKRLLAAISAAVMLSLPVNSPCRAADDERLGVSDSEVNIGSCAAQSGTLAERGNQLKIGIADYLSSINEKGINGRKIKVNFCDDRYDPEAAIACFGSCLKDKVFAGGYMVGSAPISKYVRMGEASKMPMFGYMTGTPVVYDFHPTQFVVRAGYPDEVEKQVDELWNTHGIRKIAVIYQNDAFGAAIRENVLKQLKKYNAAPVVEASYSRSTSEVEDAVKRVTAAKPEAVILGATSAAMTAIATKRDELKWPFLCMAFSVDTDYLEPMGKAADGIVLTQVIPLTDSKLPTADLYNKFRRKYTPSAQPNLTAFEAFINTMVLAEALKRAGKDLTRDKFIKAMESLNNFDLGLGPERKLYYSATNHNGWTAKSVYFTVMKDGKMVPLVESDMKDLVQRAKQH
jgi:ABC-type branched-subunit amino acid transport system substrate-binding protein